LTHERMRIHVAEWAEEYESATNSGEKNRAKAAVEVLLAIRKAQEISDPEIRIDMENRKRKKTSASRMTRTQVVQDNSDREWHELLARNRQVRKNLQ